MQDHLHALQNRLAERARALPEQNAKRNALRAAQTALLKEEKRARRRANSDAERAEVQRTFDPRRAALAEQAAQLTLERSALAEPMAADQREIKETRARLSAIDKQVQAAHADLTEKDRAITLAVAERHKEIAAIRRTVARIESEKSASYLAVGRRLREGASAELPIPDETVANLFAVSQKQQQAYERLVGLETASLRESHRRQQAGPAHLFLRRRDGGRPAGHRAAAGLPHSGQARLAAEQHAGHPDRGCPPVHRRGLSPARSSPASPTPGRPSGRD